MLSTFPYPIGLFPPPNHHCLPVVAPRYHYSTPSPLLKIPNMNINPIKLRASALCKLQRFNYFIDNIHTCLFHASYLYLSLSCNLN